MTSDYEFELPWPPSINSYWATSRGRRLISKKGRKYKKDVFDKLSELGLTGEGVSVRVAVSMTLNPPTLHKYDVDNFTKCVFDSLSDAVFWDDDELVHKLTIVKGEKSPPGNVQVKVTILD